MVKFEEIEALSERIAREFRPERIVLFGSHAQGQPGADSDVDLLVVLPFEGKPVHKTLEILRSLNSDLPVDLLVATPEGVRERLFNDDWFMRDIFEKGRVLYEADHAGIGGEGGG